MTQKLKHILRHFWIYFLNFQQSWNCNSLGPKRVLFTGDFCSALGWLLRQATACGFCRLLAPSAGPAREGRGRTQTNFSHLDLSLFASQNGEETDCSRLWRDEFGKSQGSAQHCLRKIPRWHLQWKAVCWHVANSDKILCFTYGFDWGYEHLWKCYFLFLRGYFWLKGDGV